MYYIISLTHTQKQDEFITLWRPNNAGYCYSKQSAGLYENPEKGYHDSIDNMSLSEDNAYKLWITVNYDGPEKQMIPNCSAVWKQLNVKMIKGNLKKV
jgi:hypothetical protein